MKAKLLPALIASLFAASGAHAQEGFKVRGSVTGGVLYNAEGREFNTYRLHEYRDLNSGVLSQIDVQGRGQDYFLDFYGENLGRSDMLLNLRGGRYGSFTYGAYGDWLTHNLTLGARTPYAGHGTTTLTATFPALNPNTWGRFDYAIDRSNFGGFFEYSGFSPWYVRADVNEVQSKGVNVGAASLGTSPGNGFVELPMPIDYSTKNFVLEGGYQSTAGQLSLNFLTSSFSNENNSAFLNWRNPYFGPNANPNVLDQTSLPPDNTYWRLGLNGMLRNLPLRSTLSGRVTYSNLTNNFDIAQSALTLVAPAGAGFGSYASAGANQTVFKGDVQQWTVGLSLASAPMRALDTRFFYNYIDHSNQNTQVEFNPAGNTSLNCGGAPCDSERYSYSMNNVGFEVGYRPFANNRVSGGYNFTNWDRHRLDTTNTDQHQFFVQWANSGWEDVSFRAKYTYTDRNSNFLLGNAGANSNSALWLERYVRRYDVSDLSQNALRLFADYSPLPFLDFALEAAYKHNDYDDTTLGRTKDWRQEYYLSASYGDPSSFRVTVFGDIEFVNYDGFHRTIGTVTGSGTAQVCTAPNPGCFDPGTAPNTSNFNWSNTNKDTNWMIGTGADLVLSEKLTLKGSVLYQRTQGTADFTAQTLASGAPAAFLPPIRSYDTSNKTSVVIRGVYQLEKNWEMALGYAYENYSYRDDAYNGYLYVVPGPTVPQTSYLSGAYAYPNYNANIVYTTLKYSFR